MKGFRFGTSPPGPFPTRTLSRPPITKKAPGDRPLGHEEIARFAEIIREKGAEGAVSELPAALLRSAVRWIRSRPAPPFLAEVDPDAAAAIGTKVLPALERKEVAVRVVDLGDRTGFPRESARPVCEVLLVESGGALQWIGKRRRAAETAKAARIFLTRAFVERNADAPAVLAQAILHPLLEWILDLPHIVAVLCESNYNTVSPGDGGDDVSDLNRFLAREAARDRDLAYFDRILGVPYEPDEMRLEEIAGRYGPEEGKKARIVARAGAAGRKYRELMEELQASLRERDARERCTQARTALDEGDADRALTLLRGIVSDPSAPGDLRAEAEGLAEAAVRSYALDSDPAYEGLRLEKGRVEADEWAGRKALAFRALLEESIGVIRRFGRPGEEGGSEGDPLAERGASRIIHVLPDLERPSARFLDGHDRVHWVFHRRFVDRLLAEFEPGQSPPCVAAALACRFVRDGVFPDEKLPLARQFTTAVKGALEGYRFYQALPDDLRESIERFFEASGAEDPLHRLFLRLGNETRIARAGHTIRREVARTHSYNYVRYPDTSLAGKVVVVTGGGTGMGRALALEAAIQGANVVITGRRPAPLEETKADLDALIRHLGLTNQTLAVQGDVSDPKYVGEMFERIGREFGRIDLLFNNAGVSGPVEFGSAYREEHLDAYREAVGIHLTGAWLASLEAAQRMESQPMGGVIVMVGTFYTESIHRHVLHAYPGRLPYTAAQSAKLALGDYLAWALADRQVTVLSLNPSAVSTERIQRGSGVFDKGSAARARIGRRVPPEALEKDTLNRTVGHEFVQPRDFARIALDMARIEFRRTVGGQRLPIGGVTYEQPPGVLPSPAALSRYPDLVGKVALVTSDTLLGNDVPLLEACAAGLARAGASIVLAGREPELLERIALSVNSAGGEGMATVFPVNPGKLTEVQALFDGLPRLDLLLHCTGSVDWKRPLTLLSFEEWTAQADRFGYVPRLLSWQAQRKMDRDGNGGTIAVVGPDLSGVPSIRERNLVQVFQGMLRPAVATESMERALMRKAKADGTSPGPVSAVNFGLVLPGRTDGRNRKADPARTAASVLWLAEEGKAVSGAVLLPDEQNSVARLPEEPREAPGSLAGKVAVVTGGIRNLGREISLRFAAERATVVVASRRPDPGGRTGEAAAKAREELAAADAVLSRMRAAGGRCLWVDADVSLPHRVRAVLDETRNRFGRIDLLVNNAGAGGDFSLLEEVMRDHRTSWESVLRCNFLGPWVALQHLREMPGRPPGGATVVSVSTHYADHPYLFRTIYTVSKILLKGLTRALAGPLAAENLHLADVAPTLIAGPRMDWVMRNYAGKFAEQFERLDDCSPAERNAFRERFLRSFERTLPEAERARAAASFLGGVRESRLPKGTRGEMEAWYGRIREWFRATVPDLPPSNEEVADAVLFASKNARFLENRFVGVSSLPGFESFPPPAPPRRGGVKGRSFLLLAVGNAGMEAETPPPFEGWLSRAGGTGTCLLEDPSAPGKAAIHRPGPGRPRSEKAAREPLLRELDLSEPKVLEPWLDHSLLGVPPHAGTILWVGTTAGGKGLLRFSPEEMNRFLAHLGKILSCLGESIRAVEDGGSVVLVAPSPATEEGILLRCALRQMVRTAIAERHFLLPGKRVRLSLLTGPDDPGDRAFLDRLGGILSGTHPPVVEPVPVGPERP